MSSFLPAPLMMGAAFLFDDYLLGLAKLGQLDRLELQAQVFADELPASDRRDVLHQALRRSPKPGALTATDVKAAAKTIDDEGRQGFALDIVGDDQERLARLVDFFQQRDHVAHAGELLLEYQDVAIFEERLHLDGRR